MAVDVKTFATELARSLTARGIPKDLAIKHAVSLVRTFDEEDLREISSYTDPEEFSELSESLAELIMDKEMPDKKPENKKAADKKEEPAKEEKQEETKTENKAEKEDKDELDSTLPAPKSFPRSKKPAPSADKTEELRLVRRRPDAPAFGDATVNAGRRPAAGVQESGIDMKTRAFGIDAGAGADAGNATMTFAGIKTGDIYLKPEESTSPAEQNGSAGDNKVPSEQEIYLDDDGTLPDESKIGKVELSGRGKAVFWGVAIGTLPITLAIAAVVLGVFALGIVTVCGLMAASVVLLCFEAVAGCGYTLVGVIYGAIEMISGHAGIGLYEIGLGIACGGLAMFLSILTYNLAVVALPYILKQLLSFEGYCLKGVRPMIRRFRGECSKL